MDGEEMQGLSKLKLLIYDEQPKKRKYYLSNLRMCGLREILISDNVPDAIQTVVSNAVDLVIMTPSEGGSGMELLAELRSLHATSSLPVAAIMSDVHVMSGLRMLALGVNHILMDPLSRQSVEAMVRKLFRERFGTDQIDTEIALACELFREGKLDDAHRLYARCLRMEGAARDQLFGVYLGLTQIATEKKEWLEAESNLFLALEIAKSESNRVDTHWLLSLVFYHYGKLYEKRGMQEKALKSYQTSMSFNPYQVASLKPLLVFLMKQDNFKEIARLLTEAREHFTPYSGPLGELAETLNGMAVRAQVLGMPAYAAKLYEQLLGLPHDRMTVHQDVIDHLLNAGKVSQALTALKEVSGHVRNPEILLRIGNILLDAEKRYLGGNRIKRSEELDLSFFKELDSPRTIGLAHQTFQEGLLLDPGHVELRLGIAYCLMRQGEHARLMDLLQKLKESKSLGKKLYGRVVDMLLEGRLYEPAQSWVEDAIARYPQEVVYYELAARCLRGRRKLQPAVNCLKKALTLAPDHIGITLALARLHEELGQPDDAASYYQKARKLSPDAVTDLEAPESEAGGKKIPGKKGRKWLG